MKYSAMISIPLTAVTPQGGGVSSPTIPQSTMLLDTPATLATLATLPKSPIKSRQSRQPSTSETPVKTAKSRKSRQGHSLASVLTPPTATAIQLLHSVGVAVEYLTDPAQAEVVLKELLTSSTVLGLDIETAKLDPWQEHPGAGLDPHLSRIRLVQVATADRVVVFDLDRIPLAVLQPLWTHRLVAHNALFELKHLLYAGVNPTRLHCSLLMDRVLSGSRRSLADVVGEYLQWVLDKTLQVSDWATPNLSSDQIAYAALDAVAVFRLYPLLMAGLEGRRQKEAYHLLLKAQRPVAQMELAGCPFDVASHHTLYQQWQQDQAAALLLLQAALGPGVSPTSPKQLAQWLTANLPPERLATWPKSPKGQLKTGAEALALADDLVMVQPLLTHKTVSKLLSSYGAKFIRWISPVTGRIHASFLIANAQSGRFSCNRPNLQQLPRDSTFRQLVKAGPGRQLVVADYSQVELRVAALVAGDAGMLTAYREGQDLHRKTAAAVLGIPPDQVSKAQRQMAKAVNFGLLFGQGAKGLQAYARTSYGVSMTLAEAEAAQRAFFTTYPQLRRWHQTTKRLTEQSQKTVIRGGLVRDFAKEPHGVRYTESLNTPVQGAAAAVLLATLPLLNQALSGLDAQIINLIHDEVVLEVADADVEAAKAVLVETMTAGFAAIFPEAAALGTLRDLVEAHGGLDWAAAKG